MGTDLLEQLHDGVCARELDLADGDGGAGVELAGLLLEGVQSVQAEQLVHESAGFGVELAGHAVVVERLVEVLDHHVL